MLIILLGLFSNIVSSSMDPAGWSFTYNTYMDNNMKFKLFWTILNGTHIEFGISCNTTAWCGFGIAENNGTYKMSNGDYMVGGTDTLGNPYLWDKNTMGKTTNSGPKDDNTHDLYLTNGSVVNGITAFRFIRPLYPCDTNNTRINITKNATYLWAIGSSDTFGYHGYNNLTRGYKQFQLSPDGTSSPTVAPTSPTSSPTPSPSSSPTPAPTSSPTSPTGSPTPSPSSAPTPAPTGAPTHPTGSPTPAPTMSPTHPTGSPTPAPSSAPTNAPSSSPTSVTGAPTKMPTMSPTLTCKAGMSRSQLTLFTANPTKNPTASPVTTTTTVAATTTNVTATTTTKFIGTKGKANSYNLNYMIIFVVSFILIL